MVKRYAIWQFKHWLPLFFVFTIITLLSTLTTVFSNPVAYPTGRVSENGPFLATMAFGCIVPALLMTFVMPFFVYSYRTKRVYVDTFYQADLKEGAFRQIRLLVGLAFIIVPFVAAFLTGTLVHALRYLATPDTYIVNNVMTGLQNVEYTKAAANFVAYIPLFFIGLFLLAAAYSINCFLVSLGDYILDQIFLLLFGSIFCALLVIAPAFFFLEITHGLSSEGSVVPFYFSLEPVGGFILIALLNNLFGCSPNWTASINLAAAISSTLIHIGAGCAAFIYCFRKKDPSGEYADSRGARNTAIALVPHLSAITLGLMLAILAGLTGSVVYYGGVNFVWQIFEYVTFGIIYYCLLALWRHNWKPSRIDLISFLIVMGVTLTAMILVMATYRY